MTDFIPFALPDIGDAEIEAVGHALRSGWLSSGPAVAEFERRFAEKVGPGVTALAVNSATAGLHLALEASGIGPGDEVLVPTWTFTASAEIVRYLGAAPVLVDVDPTWLTIDLEQAESLVTERTRAIIPVHFAGALMDPKTLDEFVRRHDLVCIEDAAHAFPASRSGVAVGAGSSTATVFSFYATKPITTGEGGMVVTRDAGLASRIRTMRLHGIDRNVYDRYRSSRANWRYDVVAPGYKYNLPEVAGAMGLVQLDRAEEMRSRRHEIAQRYSAALPAFGIEVPEPGKPGDTHSWHLYVVRLPAAVDRDRFIDLLAGEGVGASVHFIPLHMHSYWNAFAAARQPWGFPVADRVFGRAVSLPCFSAMTDAQVERVIEAVGAVVQA